MVLDIQEIDLDYCSFESVKDQINIFAETHEDCAFEIIYDDDQYSHDSAPYMTGYRPKTEEELEADRAKLEAIKKAQEKQARLEKKKAEDRAKLDEERKALRNDPEYQEFRRLETKFSKLKY